MGLKDNIVILNKPVAKEQFLHDCISMRHV